MMGRDRCRVADRAPETARRGVRLATGSRTAHRRTGRTRAMRLPTMPSEFLCHLPFLRMEAGLAQALAPIGRLEPLPYEDWLLLEDPVMDYQERQYRNVAP